MASGKGRWDSGNWTPGPVTLLGALGIGSHAQYPKFQPLLAIQQAASGQGGASPGGGAAPAGGAGSTTPGQGVSSTSLSGNLSYVQLEQLWVDAGGNPAVRNMAAAIAMAESGGRDVVSAPNSNGTVDRGYWQINSSWGSQSTLDPLGNARAAVAISKNGTNWNPWVTFWKGLYKPFLQPLSSQPPVNIPGSNTGSTAKGISARGSAGGGTTQLLNPPPAGSSLGT